MFYDTSGKGSDTPVWVNVSEVSEFCKQCNGKMNVQPFEFLKTFCNASDIGKAIVQV